MHQDTFALALSDSSPAVISHGISSCMHYTSSENNGKPMKGDATVVVAFGLEKANTSGKKRFIGVLSFDVDHYANLCHIEKSKLALPTVEVSAIDSTKSIRLENSYVKQTLHLKETLRLKRLSLKKLIYEAHNLASKQFLATKGKPLEVQILSALPSLESLNSSVLLNPKSLQAVIDSVRIHRDHLAQGKNLLSKAIAQNKSQSFIFGGQLEFLVKFVLNDCWTLDGKYFTIGTPINTAFAPYLSPWSPWSKETEWIQHCSGQVAWNRKRWDWRNFKVSDVFQKQQKADWWYVFPSERGFYKYRQRTRHWVRPTYQFRLDTVALEHPSISAKQFFFEPQDGFSNVRVSVNSKHFHDLTLCVYALHPNGSITRFSTPNGSGNMQLHCPPGQYIVQIHSSSGNIGVCNIAIFGHKHFGRIDC